MANVKFEYTGKLSDGRLWDEDSKKKVTVELDDSDLTVPEMLEEFMNFMQAIGYKFEIGDRFDVVNDFKDWKNNDNKVDLEFGNGTSHTDFGAVPPAVNLVLQPEDNFTLEELTAEFNRLKNEGNIDSVALAKAKSNLKYREV